MLKVDLHIHSNYIQKKGEGELSPKEIIDFYAKNHFHAIAITEHASILFNKKLIHYKYVHKTYKDFKDYAKKKNLLLIPGVETFIKGKEVVILNYQGDFTKIKTFQDLKKLKQKHKNILILAPHPYYGLPQCLKEKLEENINLFDAIEHSHVYTKFFNPNKKAIKLAKEYKKPLLGNSDAHRKFQLGAAYSLIDSKKDINSIIKAIKQNKVVNKNKPASLLMFTRILLITLKAAILRNLFKSYYL